MGDLNIDLWPPEEACRRNLDKNKLGLVTSPDLTIAFDTVDHRILIEKFKFYGVNDRLLKLLIPRRQTPIRGSPEQTVKKS